MQMQIRKAMSQNATLLKGIVEADETYIGGKARNNRHKGRKPPKKVAVLTLIDREGQARREGVDLFTQLVAV